MKKKYLNRESKLYYLDQMQRCRDLCDASDDPQVRAWAMDERLEGAMQRVNKFRCLQTMLSKFPTNAAEALAQLTAGAPVAYVQVAYAGEVKDAIREALDEACADLETAGIRAYYSCEAAPVSADNPKDLHDDLRGIDCVANQARYLDIENYLIVFEPASKELVATRGGSSDDSMAVVDPETGDLWTVDSSKLLQALNFGMETVIAALESVGKLHESDSAYLASLQTELDADYVRKQVADTDTEAEHDV